MEAPKLKSYHPRSGGKEECFFAHIIACLNIWKNILEKRYLQSIRRVLSNTIHARLSENNIKNLMRFLLINHDAGKLTNEYQTGKYWRHELISAYIVYRRLKESAFANSPLLQSIATSAVYLHHEALQISHGIEELRFPTYSYLINYLHKQSFTINEVHLDGLFELEKGEGITLKKFSLNEIKGHTIASTLGSVISVMDGHYEATKLRLAVAVILQPLVICDVLAGRERGGNPPHLAQFLRDLIEVDDV